MACYSLSSSDGEMDEMEEDFVVLGDKTYVKWGNIILVLHARCHKDPYEILFCILGVSPLAMKNFYIYSTNRKDVNFKDGDQTKYAPPTPLQLAVSTARYSWNNLSFSSVQSRLDTVGAAAAEKWALLVTGLRPQAAGGISSPVPKAPKKPVDNFDDWESKGNIDDDGWLHDCRSNEGATTGIKYPKNKVDKEPYKDKVHKIYSLHNQSLHEHNLKLRIQGEAGPRFQQEEQKYDPLGVSKAWQRGAKQEESIKRKQKLLAQWRGKEEKGAYQKHLGTRADTGLPSSALCKKTLSTKKKEDTNQRMQTHGCAHTGVYQAEKDPSKPQSNVRAQNEEQEAACFMAYARK